MAVASDLKAGAKAAIAQHLRTHGSREWNRIIEMYPQVSEQSIWRWIREVKAAETPPAELAAARERLQASIKKDVEKHLPVAPSPAYVARAGDQAIKNIDFVVEIQKLYADAMLLRQYAVTEVTDEVTGEVSTRIKNPNTFDRSIARRANLLESAIRAVQEIWDLRQMQSFYEIVIDEIGHADPRVQRAILERLAALNARTGMTMAFRV